MSSKQKLITKLFSIVLVLEPRHPRRPAPNVLTSESKLRTREGGSRLTRAQGERSGVTQRPKYTGQPTSLCGRHPSPLQGKKAQVLDKTTFCGIHTLPFPPHLTEWGETE